MTGTMVELAPGVAAWMSDEPAHDAPNAGAVVESDGVTVIDTMLVPSQATPLLEVVQGWGVPIRRCVYTSSHVESVGGSSVFWMAARYGRSHTSSLLDQPASGDALAALHPAHAIELAELVTRPVSHTVSEPVWLTPALQLLPTAGHQAENLVVLAPGADVLFAGAMACFGSTPNCFDGSPMAWSEALDALRELATIVVPAVGPLGGTEELDDLAGYLRACVEAEGDPTAVEAGPWDRWTGRDLDEVNVERAAMLADGDASVPPTMLRRLGLG
jgi:glyoxylase-like metal-dependent hydrolase (beta-lactamase superfamily II)